MIQTLYAIIAIFMLAILSLTMNRSIHSNDTKMILNEVSSQVAPVAMDVIDYMATLKYDATLLLDDPMVASPDKFADPIEGSPICLATTNLDGCYDTMNELHGKRITREIHGLTYHIDVWLTYVDVLGDSTSAPTFNKMVKLNVRSPQLTAGSNGEPLVIRINRLFSYPRLTG